jgi:hypothetical protein
VHFDQSANLNFWKAGLFADRPEIDASPGQSLQGGLPCLWAQGAKVQMRRGKHGRIPPGFKVEGLAL